MSFVRAFLTITATLVLLTTSAFAAFSINAPSRIGVPLDKPFVYLIPATGEGNLLYVAKDLPRGLKLNTKTGIITGSTKEEGTHEVLFTVLSRSGSANKKVEMVVSSSQSVMSLTPIMGWNPWYVWGCNIDDKKIRQAADLLVSSGLAAHGYNYINLDDCWQGKRNAAGEMVPNERFPDMKALADYVHSKGLRIGIYTGPGPKTCAGYQASEGRIEQDVMTYAKWGMDLIKYDWCKPQPKEAAPYIKVYQEMTDILARSPRAMVHMICQYGNGNPWEWGEQVGGNMWRTDHDLADHWDAVVRNGFNRVHLAKYQKPGHWNDLDMLMVGKANWPVRLGSYTIPSDPPRPTKLTVDEQLTHISLWAIMATPWLFSGDLAQLDAHTMKMLTNKDVLAINQDALGAPAKRLRNANGTQVIGRKLEDGSVALAFFNLNTTKTEIRFDYANLGLPAGRQFKIRNLWSAREAVSEPHHTAIRATVPAHGVVFMKVTAQ